MGFLALNVTAQTEVYTADQDAVIQLIRNDKMKLVLPQAMRDNEIDMWIHAGRHGDPNPLEYEFGIVDGFLILTDTGDKIEKAMFGGVFTGSGGVEDIDHHGSMDVARAFAGYDPFNVKLSVYDEIGKYVAERDPKSIAVNYSEWLAVADGISYTQFELLKKIIGPKYAERIVSAENLITDFRSRRLLREIVIQANTLELARQNTMKILSQVKPGVTAIWQLPHSSLLHSASSGMKNLGNPDYTLQRGDLFYVNGVSNWMDFGHTRFSEDTKYYGYILQEGETEMPKALQYAYNQAIKGQWIMRPTVQVGKKAGEVLSDMIKSMEDAGYIYTPFTDDGSKDSEIIRKALANTDKSGFSVDLHVQGNNNGELITVGASMAPFRRDRDHLVIKENHIFAFEYMVHTKVPGREQPLSINVSNVQAVSNLGVEWIQPPNTGVYLIH
jgi:hypothetical protein